MIQMRPSVAVSAVVNSIRQFYDAGSGVTQTTMLGASGSVPALYEDFTTGQTIDPRITFTRASNATRFDSTGTLVTMANNEPRFNYDPVTLQPKGLLIEEQRTNSIRNNTMVGAVAGSPGTLPKNWGIGNAGALSSQVVGFGTENGVNYIDIRFFGTASASSVGVRFETSVGVAASSGQTWTGSVFARLVGGTTANVTAVGANVVGLTSGGSSTTDTVIVNFGNAINASNISGNRIAATRTLSDATTVYLRHQLLLGIVSGGSIDITLRIGMPQLEQGAFATSVIPTTTTAATRAADASSMTGTNFSSWYRQDEGTIFVEFMRSGDGIVAGGGGATPRVVNVDDGINSYQIRFNSTSTIEATSSAGIYIARAWYADAINKSALAYKADDSSFVVNASVASDATGSAAASMTNIKFGAATSGVSGFLNGHIRRIAYFPRRLSNDELQAITA